MSSNNLVDKFSRSTTGTIIRTISISKEQDDFLKSHREINFSEVCRKTIDELMERTSSEYTE